MAKIFQETNEFCVSSSHVYIETLKGVCLAEKKY